MEQSGNKISCLLIITTLLWILQMLISVVIKEYNIFPADEETQENYKLVALELFTKILGIITVMLADWLLLNFSSGIQQTLPLAQLVFIFLSMVFAGDYGLPVAYFLEVFRGTSDDLKHYPLYKKTWSHNVVFQTGMYFLFTWIIIVEQIHVYKVSRKRKSSRRSEPPASDHDRESRSKSSMSDGEQVPSTDPAASSIGCYLEVIRGYCNEDVLRCFIKYGLHIWPVVVAAVIAYYSHIMKIYLFTTAFYVVILILLIVFRCIRYKDGDWSFFHRQCHPAAAEDSTALQITFGLFLKVAVWGLVILVLLILYQEVGMTSSKLTLVGIPTLVAFSVICLLHMSDFP